MSKKITLTAVDNHGVSYPYETTAEQLVAENKRLTELVNSVDIGRECERLRAENLLLAMANTDREQLKAENAELQQRLHEARDCLGRRESVCLDNERLNDENASLLATEKRLNSEADVYQARAFKAETENAELREAVVDYFSMPSSEKKRAIRLKFGLPVPCDHVGIGRPGCPTCDPRRPGAGT